MRTEVAREMPVALRAPRSIDIASKRGGYVVKEVARLVLAIREPHIAIAARLERLVDVALEVAPKDGMLAYPRPSGDWMDPKPPAKIKSHVRAVAKGQTNATMSLSSLDDERSFELEYEAYLPIWLTRGHASQLVVTFDRQKLYADPEGSCDWFERMLAVGSFSAATLGLALEGHYAQVYPLALDHLGLDISSPSSVCHDIGDRVHGIGWLTAIASSTLARLGKRRVTGLHGEPLEGGVSFRLSDTPTRGTTPSQLAPYAALALALEPELHVPRQVSYFTCGFDDGSPAYQGREQAMQDAWHRRFFLDRKALRSLFGPAK